MTQVLSFEDLEKLWLGNTDSSINKAEINVLISFITLFLIPYEFTLSAKIKCFFYEIGALEIKVKNVKLNQIGCG